MRDFLLMRGERAQERLEVEIAEEKALADARGKTPSSYVCGLEALLAEWRRTAQ